MQYFTSCVNLLHKEIMHTAALLSVSHKTEVYVQVATKCLHVLKIVSFLKIYNLVHHTPIKNCLHFFVSQASLQIAIYCGTDKWHIDIVYT